VSLPDVPDAVVAAVQQAEARGAHSLHVSTAVMAKLTERDNPPPVLGVYRIVEAAPPQVASVHAKDAWLALEHIRDPGNLGTILRTAHAVGLTGVMLIGPCCDPTAPDCVQAAMGSAFAMPVARLNEAAFCVLAGAWPTPVIGTHLAGEPSLAAISATGSATGPVLIVMGSEGAGLSDAVAAVCQKLVRIPMRDGVDSLNLSVATGLILYQTLGSRLLD
jgi:RNA methyltransferase, TrmH family